MEKTKNQIGPLTEDDNLADLRRKWIAQLGPGFSSSKYFKEIDRIVEGEPTIGEGYERLNKLRSAQNLPPIAKHVQVPGVSQLRP